jgi:hypothetical protein
MFASQSAGLCALRRLICPASTPLVVLWSIGEVFADWLLVSWTVDLRKNPTEDREKIGCENDA